jgi:chromate transporter
MFKKIKKTSFNIAVMVVTFSCSIIFSLLAVRFSSIFYILIFGAVGLLCYAVRLIKGEGTKGGKTEK